MNNEPSANFSVSFNKDEILLLIKLLSYDLLQTDPEIPRIRNLRNKLLALIPTKEEYRSNQERLAFLENEIRMIEEQERGEEEGQSHKPKVE